MANEKGQFVKGEIPWNKGVFGVTTYPNRKSPEPFTEEHKAKISATMKTVSHGGQFEIGQSSPNLGKKATEEIRRKMSVSSTGERSSMWKGGVTLGNKKKEYYRKKTLERVARKHNATGSHSKDEWDALKIRWGMMCLCCKKEEPKISLTEDHIVPLSKGGSDYIDNIQPLCLSCNCRKNAKESDYRTLVKV